MSPPQNRADAPIEYISRTDPAWDMDRVNEEIGALDEDDKQDHPLVKYVNGVTRYDLSAPGIAERTDDGETVMRTPRDYLTGTPCMWTLRRHGLSELSSILGHAEERSQEIGFRSGVKALDGGPDVNFKTTKLGRMTGRTVDDLYDRLGSDAIYEVGQASINASRAPSYAEKK